MGRFAAGSVDVTELFNDTQTAEGTAAGHSSEAGRW